MIMQKEIEKDMEWRTLVTGALCKHEAMIKELTEDREALESLVQRQHSVIELLKDLMYAYRIELAGYSEGE